MKILLIRHGRTKGNLEHRYLGATDEDLLPEEKQLLANRSAENFVFMDMENAADTILYVSPLLRCRRTAEYLFPGKLQKIIPEFREMEFGEFEYKNYQELHGHPVYQEYLDTNGESAFPGGESKAEFCRRTTEAFCKICKKRISEQKSHFPLAAPNQDKKTLYGEAFDGTEDMELQNQTICIVAHGGTIMAILDRFSEPHRGYFDWHCDCLQGFLAEMQPDSEGSPMLQRIRRVDLR